MVLDRLLRERRSIRAFSDNPVEDQTIDELLQAALLSPSWSNTQPYRIAIAKGEVRDHLANELTQKFNAVDAWQNASLPLKALKIIQANPLPDGDFKPILKYPKELQKRRAETGFGLYNHLGIERHDKTARTDQMARNFSFFDAPVAMFVFIHKGLGAYSALDAGIFLQSLMLAATEKGLGTCAQGALATWRSPIDRYFDVPQDYQLICGLALGYPTEDKVNQFQPGRRSVSEIKIAQRSAS